MRVPWPILVLVLIFPTVGALVYFVAAHPDDPFFRIAYAASKVVQFALPIFALAAFDRDRLRAVRPSARGAAAGIVFGLATGAAILGVYAQLLRGGPFLAGLADTVRTKAAGFGLDVPGRFVVFAAFLSVGHAFLEEYYWRWFVFGVLRARLPRTTAIVVSSLAFAGHHVVVLHIYFPDRFWTATLPFALAVAAGGAVWAWLYDWSGSLAGPWAAHALIDVALMAVGYDLLYR